MPVSGRTSVSLLSSRDETWHDEQRRLINSAFNLSSILKYEPWVDDTVRLLLHKIRKQLDNKGAKGGTLDLHKRLSFFAADV